MSSVNYKIAITSLSDEEPLGHFIVVDGENKPYYIGLSENSSVPSEPSDPSLSVSTIRVKCNYNSSNTSAGYVTLSGVIYDTSNSNFVNDVNKILNIVGFVIDESEPIAVVESTDTENINNNKAGDNYSVLLTLSYVGTNDVRNYIFHDVLTSWLMRIKSSTNSLNKELLIDKSAEGLSSIFVSDNGDHLWGIVQAHIISAQINNVNIVGD